MIPSNAKTGRTRWVLPVTLAAVICIGLLAAAAFNLFSALEPISAGADASDPAQVTRGQAIYIQHCASCHGAKLEGQPDWQTRMANNRLPANFRVPAGFDPYAKIRHELEED